MSITRLTVKGNSMNPSPNESSNPPAQAPDSSHADEPKTLEEKIVAAIKQVYDPELPANIYELGLIYNIDIKENNDVTITMTLTTPACPSAQEIPLDVRKAVAVLAEVNEVEVEIVFDPPWTPEKMSPIAKVQLGMF